MTVISSLLKIDAGKLDLPKKKFEIKRLSAMAGEPVIFNLSGVSDGKLDEIREMNTVDEGETVNVNVQEIRLATIVAGVVEPSFKDKDLMDHYGVKTPYDLVKKILLAGERDSIYQEISKLSGYDENAVEEVKKL